MTTRAKFLCTSEKRVSWSSVAKVYEFTAVYDDGIAAENRSFATATPTGTLTIQVDNPAVTFELNKYYYLDITEAE